MKIKIKNHLIPRKRHLWWVVLLGLLSTTSIPSTGGSRNFHDISGADTGVEASSAL
jgi:hypothetical protein